MLFVTYPLSPAATSFPDWVLFSLSITSVCLPACSICVDQWHHVALSKLLPSTNHRFHPEKVSVIFMFFFSIIKFAVLWKHTPALLGRHRFELFSTRHFQESSMFLNLTNFQFTASGKLAHFLQPSLDKHKVVWKLENVFYQKSDQKRSFGPVGPTWQFVNCDKKIGTGLPVVNAVVCLPPTGLGSAAWRKCGVARRQSRDSA